MSRKCECSLSCLFAHFYWLLLYRVTHEDFVHLSQIIEFTFPTESAAVYYDHVNSRNSRGKLFSAFKNLRSALIDCALVVPRRKRRLPDEEFVDADGDNSKYFYIQTCWNSFNLY